METIREDFENAKNVKEIFDIDLGNGHNQLLSAYYPVGSNIIVLNKTPLKRVTETKPELMKPYMFVALLHEYIHSLGYLDENTVRKLTHDIAKSIFNGSTITEMAKDMTKFFPFLLYPGGHPVGDKMDVIELDEIDYIG